MKTIKGLLAACAAGLLTIAPLKAQNICLVTADFELGHDYIVIWEQFADLTNLDSVFIYRKQGIESSFTKVGAVDIGPMEQTYFRDETITTMDTTKYAIAILDSSGNVGALSPWHQSVVLDYQGNGELWWTPYKKQDQVDDSYIIGYEFQTDESGFGNFVTNAQMANDEFYWLDEMYQFQPQAQYVVLTHLPDCQFITKANINTSRSNIKQQYSNASASIAESKLMGLSYTLAPNPATDVLNVVFEEAVAEATGWISGINGEGCPAQMISGTDCSFDISHLAQGVYFVHVLNKGVISTVKWIKH